MTTISAFHAKKYFNSLLKRAAKGEAVQISMRGVPVAKLVPVLVTEQRDLAEVAREIRELRKRATLGRLKIRDLIEQGRR